MKKRVISLLISICMVIGLSACGGGNTATQSSSSTSSGTTATETTQSGPSTELNIVFMQMAANIPDLTQVQDAVNKMTKEKINSTVKLTGVSVSNFSQQIKLMLASQEKIDLLVTGTLPFEDFAGQLANKQLMAMDDLIAQYGPGIKTALGDYIGTAKSQGKTYALPTLKDMAKAPGFAIRKDMVDKYKIDLSTVKGLADIEPILKTLKENEPDIAPFSPCQEPSSGIDASMHIPGGDSLSSDYYYTGILKNAQTDTKLVNYYETPEATEMFNLVRKWNQAGYIMKGVLTNTEDTKSLVKSGKVASYLQDTKPGIEQQASQQCGMPMKVVPLAPAISNTNGPDCFMWAIPSYSKNGKQAMQMLNLMYSDKDLFNLLNWGIEGKHYVKTADGLIDFPQGVNSSNSGYPVFSSFMWGNQLLSYVFKGDSPKLYDEYAELNKTAIKSKGLGFIYDAGSKKTENAACLNVWQQYDKSLGVGAVDPNKVLPVFINKLKAAGVDKIIADKQQQFDEWLKTNGTK